MLDALYATNDYKIAVREIPHAGEPLLSNASGVSLFVGRTVYTRTSTRQTALTVVESSLYRPDTFLSL